MPSRLARAFCAAILAAALLAYLTPAVFASDDAPAAEVGRLAPELRVQELINAPEGMTAENLNWASLRGKVVVLEFWATWCGPCVAAIPHLNRLTEEFADEDVVFIAVTNEAREVVEPFLERRPIHGIVALNTERNMGRDYGVRGIPHTVIVDRHGRIADVTHPQSLTADRIRSYMSGWRNTPAPRPTTEDGKPIPRDRWIAGTDPYLPIDTPPVFQVILREAVDPEKRMMGMSTASMTLNAVGRRAIINAWFQPSPGLFDISKLGEDDETLYDLILWYDHRNPAMRGIVEKLLCAELGIEIQRETRTIPTFQLRVAPEGHKFELEEFSGELSSYRDGDTTVISGATMYTVARSIGGQLGGPVEDLTGIKGYFDISFQRPPADDFAAWQRMLREEFGLVLTRGEMEAEVLVIVPISSAQAVKAE